MAVLEIFNGIYPGLQIVVPIIGLYLLPGLAIVFILFKDVSLRRSETLIFAFGIGIALPPLLLELSHVIGLPWERWTVLGYLGASALVLIKPSLAIMRRWRSFLTWSLTDGLLVWLTVLVWFDRLYIVRDLPAGLWGDSYHHTMMAQLLVDNHGLFSSWEPYAPLATFTYHFGFHANVAFFHWLTDIPVTQSVVEIGQVLNAATVPMAFLLTARLSGNRNAGVWAALLTAFLNSQPAFYVNWGRYTQLAGQVILPMVLVAWMNALENERLNWRLIGLGAIVSAGLALTHYIVTIFAALFLALYIFALWIRNPTRQPVVQLTLRLLAITLLAFALTVPWLANTLNGYLARNALGFVNGAISSTRIAEYAALPSIVPLYLKWQILAIAAIGVVVALLKRDWRILLMLAWAQLLLLIVVPYIVGLPGSGIVDYFAVYIALYLPVIPLAGYTFGVAQTRLERWSPRLTSIVAAGGLIVLSIWGITLHLGQVDLQYQLFTPADAKAMEWIRQNTPADARFLVNAFPAYGGTLIAGSDGGWWIPLLTGRQTNLPPLTYGSERGSAPDFSRRTNNWAAQLRGKPLVDLAPVRIDLTTPSATELLRAANIRYVYHGANASPGASAADWIDIAPLRARPDLFHLEYEQEGVVIFALEQQSP